jgi:hypothetical protein
MRMTQVATVHLVLNFLFTMQKQPVSALNLLPQPVLLYLTA